MVRMALQLLMVLLCQFSRTNMDTTDLWEVVEVTTMVGTMIRRYTRQNITMDTIALQRLLTIRTIILIHTISHRKHIIISTTPHTMAIMAVTMQLILAEICVESSLQCHPIEIRYQIGNVMLDRRWSKYLLQLKKMLRQGIRRGHRNWLSDKLVFDASTVVICVHVIELNVPFAIRHQLVGSIRLLPICKGSILNNAEKFLIMLDSCTRS